MSAHDEILGRDLSYYSTIFPIGSVSLVSSCNNEEKVQREDVLSSLKPEADTVNRVCDNLHLDAEEIKLKVKDIVPESDAMMNG
ncbi:unnamed protein product [Trichobilharzia regenti]|nr:unnamed protein product [Trichobilharzia regenti]